MTNTKIEEVIALARTANCSSSRSDLSCRSISAQCTVYGFAATTLNGGARPQTNIEGTDDV
jgi:hypothetical protein